MTFEMLEAVHADARIVSISGDFDLSFVEQAQEVLAVASADPERVLVIDLTECTFLDSTGIGAIVGAARALTNGQIKISIACRADSEVLAILQLAGIDQTVPILETVEAALACALAIE